MNELIAFLRRNPPFDMLPPEVDSLLAQQASRSRYSLGEVVFREGESVLDRLYVIESGAVVLTRGRRELMRLRSGDAFGYVSLVSDLAASATAVVIDDVTLIELPKPVFLELFERHEQFARFFTRGIAHRVHLRSTSPSTGDEGVGMVSLREVPGKKPIIVSAGETIVSASRRMAERNATFVLVEIDGTYGIVTERDIIKKVIAEERNPAEVTALDIATRPLVTIDENALFFDAVLTMASHAIRKLPVSRGGTVVSVLEESDIIAYESKNAIFLLKEVDRAKTIEDLAGLFGRLKEGVVDLVARGAHAEQIGRYIAELNDRFVSRTADITKSDLPDRPIGPFVLLALGSEGRREQSLTTDQDIALIVRKSDETDQIERFSRSFTENLLRIGYPPCPGDVMISNAFWRRDLASWVSQATSWIETPKPQNVLNIAIFFDFRPVYGDASLADELWEVIVKTIRRSKLFLPYLALEAVRFKPPVGFFKNIIVEKGGAQEGKFDIKKGGIYPIVQGIRVLALDRGLRDSSTFVRIRELARIGALARSSAVNLEESYAFLMDLRFRNQAEQIRKGVPADNYINPNMLGKVERHTLMEVFSVIKELQEALFEKYSLKAFS
ncbi:MAG: hypothetical protein FD164_397 [Nitrospirae bacterium]|nr:MAG: hypothetical protein FD164_397 [Nitrospirota bacterium]